MGKLVILDRYKDLSPRTVAKADNRLIKAVKHLNWPLLKIFATIIAQPGADSFGFYKCHIRELMELANLGEHGCEEYVIHSLDNAVKSTLVLPKVEVNGTGLGTAIIPPFTLVHYNPSTGMIAFELNKYIEPFIHDLRANFTTVGLTDFKKLKSFRQGQLFMLICFCRNLNSPQMRTFSLEWLLPFLNIDMDQSWRNIWISLMRCTRAVEEYTGCSFSVRFLRMNRRKPKKVTHIQIDIKGNKKLKPLLFKEKT